jgi:hypothetical protein
MLGFATQLRLVERDYYCRDCQFTWPKHATRHRRRDHNKAPYYFIEGVEQTTRPAGRESSSKQADDRQEAA